MYIGVVGEGEVLNWSLLETTEQSSAQLLYTYGP